MFTHIGNPPSTSLSIILTRNLDHPHPLLSLSPLIVYVSSIRIRLPHPTNQPSPFQENAKPRGMLGTSPLRRGSLMRKAQQRTRNDMRPPVPGLEMRKKSTFERIYLLRFLYVISFSNCFLKKKGKGRTMRWFHRCHAAALPVKPVMSMHSNVRW